MSIHAHPARVDHELEAVVARAGGILCTAHDRPGRSVAVALNYGSAAGELAACVSRVGLADRSDLVKLSVQGPQSTLAQVVSGLADATLAPGGALCTGSAWWCATGPEQVLVVSEPAGGDRLHGQIRRLVARHPALRIHDVSQAWAAIAVVGRRTGEVLADLGVYGVARDPRSVAPVTAHPVAGAEVTWLLQSDDRALALTARRDGPAVWRALQATGRRFGICAVGHEAIARYALLARGDSGL